MSELLTPEEAIEILERWYGGGYATQIEDMNPAVKLGIKALKAQLAKVRDRPDREKARREINAICFSLLGQYLGRDLSVKQLNNKTDQILALFLDIEEAKRGEGERMLRILKYICKQPDGSYRITDEDWQALKGGKE